MSNYKPDLELRLAVCLAANPDANAWIADDEVWMQEHDSDYALVQLKPDISFDAIMPLIHDREFWKAHQKDIILYMQNLLEGGFFMDGTNFIDSANMFIFELKPWDYCRAYLAAKGEKE